MAIIPVRVPADLRVTLASEKRFPAPAADHPLHDVGCPVCDHPLGSAGPIVLVFAGIQPDDRKDAGWTTGEAVAVHALCAGVDE